MARTLPRTKKLEIGKRVHDKELTGKAAATEYKISPGTVRSAVNMYRETLGGGTPMPAASEPRSAFSWQDRALKAEAERDTYQKLLLKVGEQL